MKNLYRLPCRDYTPRNDGDYGFTFIELLVVITIIGVIFASGIVSFSAITVRSRDTRRKADLEAIRQSLEMCRSLTGSYPDATYVYQANAEDSVLSCGASGPQMVSKTPYDPKPCDAGSAYNYVKLSAVSYALSASCMEVDTGYQVTNP